MLVKNLQVEINLSCLVHNLNYVLLMLIVLSSSARFPRAFKTVTISLDIALAL